VAIHRAYVLSDVALISTPDLSELRLNGEERRV